MNMDANIGDKDVRMEKDPLARTASCLIYKGRYGGSTVAVKEFYGSIPMRINPSSSKRQNPCQKSGTIMS